MRIQNLKIAFLFLFLFNFVFVFAQTSSQNGNWEDNSTWDGNSNSPGSNFSGTVRIRHTVTLSSYSLNFDGTLIIEDNGELIVNNEHKITVNEGGELEVSGDLTSTGDLEVISGNGNGNGGSIVIKSGGNAEVKDMTITATATNGNSDNSVFEIEQGGSFTATGDFTNNNGGNSDKSTAVNRGELNVGGDYTDSGEIDNFGSIKVVGNIDDDNTVHHGSEGGTIENITALPIELIHFTAKVQGNGQVMLTWATASEENNDFFTIERAGRDGEFEIILSKEGAGNSIHRIDYEAVDKNAPNGINYYRLKQTDFDGTYEYSKVVAVQIGDRAEGLTFKAYPNPTNDVLNVELPSNLDFDAQLTLSNMQGAVKMQENISGQGGNLKSLSLNHLPRGVYLLTIFDGEQVETKKVILK